MGGGFTRGVTRRHAERRDEVRVDRLAETCVERTVDRFYPA
jgi:hypothetical protein